MINSHPTYSPEQLQLYYDRISLPSHYRELLSETPSIGNTARAHSTLAVLQKYHLAAIPFENLELLYSPHHHISVAPGDVFDKIVRRGVAAGRGGWCLEMNSLFGTVLRSLGFTVFATGARVSTAVQPVAATKSYPGHSYDPWNHMVNIVTMDSKRFLVDVGFGASGGPTHPVCLDTTFEAINILPQAIRLTRAPIEDNSDQSLLMWCLAHCDSPHGEDAEWVPTYCFTETEFLPSDFIVTNHFLVTHPSSWWTRMVLAVKKIMDEREMIVGEVTLVGNEIKRRIGGKSEVLATFQDEEGRVTALQEHLGISLTESERQGICGLQTELL